MVAREEASKALAERGLRRAARSRTLGLLGAAASGRQLIAAVRGLELPIARPQVTRSAHFVQSKVGIVSEIFENRPTGGGRSLGYVEFETRSTRRGR